MFADNLYDVLKYCYVYIHIGQSVACRGVKAAIPIDMDTMHMTLPCTCIWSCSYMHASEYTYQSECEMSMCGRELANERTSQTLENSDDTQQVLVTESVDAEDRHRD